MATLHRQMITPFRRLAEARMNDVKELIQMMDDYNKECNVDELVDCVEAFGSVMTEAKG